MMISERRLMTSVRYGSETHLKSSSVWAISLSTSRRHLTIPPTSRWFNFPATCCVDQVVDYQLYCSHASKRCHVWFKWNPFRRTIRRGNVGCCDVLSWLCSPTWSRGIRLSAAGWGCSVWRRRGGLQASRPRRRW